MSIFQPPPAISATPAASAGFADRDGVVRNLTGFTEADKAALVAGMEHPQRDESLLGGLELFLDNASKARFLNTLKLEKCGEWLGEAAPDRLQIRLNEIARQSQHPAFAAFRTGLARSGGLERAYPKSKL